MWHMRQVSALTMRQTPLSSPTHHEAHGAGMEVAVLLVPPLMEALHVAAVEVNERLLVGRGERLLAWDNEGVQAHGTLGTTGVQVVQHLFQVPLGLRGSDRIGEVRLGEVVCV